VRTNPLLDSLHYMIQLKSWTTVVFDLLLILGIAVAVWVWRQMPEQRTGQHIWKFLARCTMGSMWWQQVVWKTPPTYGGLEFWTKEMVKYASTDLQRSFLTGVVLAHFRLFAPQVFLVEVLISVSLLLGLWSRFGAGLGVAMAINLSLGLYRSPGEWPWTYVFLILVMGLFVSNPPGTSLGLDALLQRRRDNNGSRS
jgi:uncharacterized membrane protein YphA (DoxX/SURF4 family)